MEVKTNELIGSALDWAVAQCEGVTEDQWYWYFNGLYAWECVCDYTTNWGCGGPILEREMIELTISGFKDSLWQARSALTADVQCGPTPLIAAMRCYVASKLGDEVKIPEELQ